MRKCLRGNTVVPARLRRLIRESREGIDECNVYWLLWAGPHSILVLFVVVCHLANRAELHAGSMDPSFARGIVKTIGNASD